MTRHLVRALALVMATAFQLHCSAPASQLVAQGYVGERVVHYIWQPSGARGDEAGRLYSLRIRICHLREDGVEVNCTQTVILENVQPLSRY